MTTYRFHPPSIVEVVETGDRYGVTRILIYTSDGIITDPPAAEIVNVCKHCQRGDWMDVPPQTFEQAVGRGWLVKLP